MKVDTARPVAAGEVRGGIDFAGIVKEAGFAALVTLGLSIPMLAFDTHTDMSNTLIVVPRWSWPIGAAIAVFVVRLVALTLRARRTAIVDTLAHSGAGGEAALKVYDGMKPARRPQQTRKESRAEHLFKNNLSLIVLAFLLVFPIATTAALGGGGALKWINNYGIQILIYVMLGWGLNIVVGLAGLLDLGYVAFYAVGAYSYALLSTTFGWSFWICLPLAGILAALWGIILGFPVLRLRGDYLAIVTLAFGEIIRLVLINWTDLTNGYAGISSIPRATFFGVPFTDDDDGFAHLFGLQFAPIQRTIFLFYLILGLALLTNFVTLRLRRLPVGRAWEALREDEIACRSLGINTVNTKLTAFALGAMFGGFAGSFFAVRQGFVSPESFTFIESATILAIVVLGGMGSQIGVAIAATVLIGGTEILRELDFLKRVFGDNFDPVQYRMLIFGFGMVVMMIWKPRGIIATREPSIFLKERKTISGDLVKEGHG